MTPYAVDANSINEFQKERVAGTPGVAHHAIESIFANDCIALDEQKLCLQEWVDCAGGKSPYALMDWISDELVNGTIRFFELADNSCRKHLLSLGLPQPDHKWVRLALGSGGRKLVSEDIDFFDPTLKKSSVESKNLAKQRRSGNCCKSLWKQYNIEVMCLAHVGNFGSPTSR